MAPFLFCFILLILLHSDHLPLHSAAHHYSHCPPFTCGNFGEVGFPFTNPSNPDCGSIILDCASSDPAVKFREKGRWLHVELINYSKNVIVIHDHDLHDQLISNQCGSLKNFTDDELPVSTSFKFNVTSPVFPFFKCKREKSDDSHDQDQKLLKSLRNFTDCVDNYDLYFTEDNKTSLPLLTEPLSHRCSTVDQLPPPWNISGSAISLHQIHAAPSWDPSRPSRNLVSLWDYKYSLRWEILPACLECRQNKEGLCLANPDGSFLCGGFNHRGKSRRRRLIIAFSLLMSTIVLIVILLYHCSRKRYLTHSVFWKRSKNAQFFKDFLQNHASLAPRRYTYSDIKKMTNSFKRKLGEGGYGGVFKGKLLDGRLVAVKVLKESKDTTKEEEFINEVVSISRTSHVNIVSLLGFCFQGSKRAIVYEFMPNGSLDKYIYNNKSSSTCTILSLEMLYEIAIGIAKGLEYLHRGCSMRIVHFDIKPHNILLDQNFCPKISDFGLAKLCQRKDSIISMLGARGTIGYIAPELICVNYGGVSHKSDVYSYGMMVLEMVGGRHNTDVQVNRTSEIYFPYWLYQHLQQDKALEILQGVVSEAQRDIARKMILVGLWCIQTNPSDRPSMNGVLEMLESSLESLETPPNPFLCSPEGFQMDSFTM